MADMQRFWISWVHYGEDHSPLTSPPNQAVLGWWFYGFSGEGVALCALVGAEDEEAGKKAVQVDWPDAGVWPEKMGWRFCNLVASDYVPNDRFSIKDWMRERCKGR